MQLNHYVQGESSGSVCSLLALMILEKHEPEHLAYKVDTSQLNFSTLNSQE